MGSTRTNMKEQGKESFASPCFLSAVTDNINNDFNWCCYFFFCLSWSCDLGMATAQWLREGCTKSPDVLWGGFGKFLLLLLLLVLWLWHHFWEWCITQTEINTSFCCKDSQKSKRLLCLRVDWSAPSTTDSPRRPWGLTQYLSASCAHPILAYSFLLIQDKLMLKKTLMTASFPLLPLLPNY